jgi:outer membrane receptor protein involved in Fe transport
MKRLHIRLRTSLFGSAAALAFATCSPAFAQEAPPPSEQAVTEGTEDVQPGQLEGSGQLVVVTAQKREEPILDIPQSVTVVSGDTLERQQSTTFEDYASLIPGLSFQQTNPGNTRIILRGVNTGGVSATVAVYIDETPFGSSSGLVNGAILAGDFDTFDVDRLEVLRGPQGTLYGASSLGGVVKFVTNAPKLGETSARARAGIETVKGGDIGWNTTGVVNVPLGDKAALRASGYYRKDGGWIDATEDALFIGSAGSRGGNNINDAKNYGGRASLLFQPSDPLSIRLSAILQTIDAGADTLIEVGDNSQKPVGDGLVQTVFLPEHTKTRYRVYNGTLDYDFGFASLLTSTSYARLKQNFLVDLTPTLGNGITFFYGTIFGLDADLVTRPLGAQQDQFTGFKKFTQELRLTSPSNDHFEWMAGAYYTKEKGLIAQDINAYDLLAGELATDLPNIGLANLPTDYKEYAGFANVTWHATDRFDITGGGRWGKNKQKMVQDLSGALFATAITEASSSENVFTYSIAPRFDINDQTAVYARIAKGYRPGGPNILPANAPVGTPATYKADSIISYETGLKADVGSRLSLDLSAYLLKWKDVQLFTVINNVGLNANGGKATSKGLEGSLRWRPVRGLQLVANAAYINAKLDEDAPDAGGFKGDRLPWVPKTSFSLNADYDWSIATDTQAFVGGGVRFVGPQSADFDAPYAIEHGHQRKVDSYAVLDLRAGVDFRRFTIEAYVKNLTNSHGLTTVSLPTELVFGNPVLPGGALSAGIIQPRTIGLTAATQF